MERLNWKVDKTLAIEGPMEGMTQRDVMGREVGGVMFGNEQLGWNLEDI